MWSGSDARTRALVTAILAIGALTVSALPQHGAAQPAPTAVQPDDVRPVAAPAADTGSQVRTEAELRAAWADPLRRRIDLGADIVLRDCAAGDPIRESPYPMVLDGHGHAVRQTCFEKRLLRQDGTGYLELRDVTLTRGGSDGPGAAVTSRGEITILDSVVKQNLSEEPGGGVFSMRRVTVRRSRINGNLANDDGGGVYARRGGVQVYDSVLSNNLVDGSGGAIGSTGDILVVRSQVDGNTTDGDGGALYADEDGDVTVVGLADRRQRRRRPGRGDLHPRRRRRGARLDADRQPRRRPRRRGLGRGRRAGRQLHGGPQPRRRPRRRRHLGPRQPDAGQLHRHQQLRRGRGRRHARPPGARRCSARP